MMQVKLTPQGYGVWDGFVEKIQTDTGYRAPQIPRNGAEIKMSTATYNAVFGENPKPEWFRND